MPEPIDVTQLDLQNLPPEQAAALARAHQQALAAQQHHALLGMLGTVPELQKAGAAEYEQAGRERAGGQQTAAGVLKIALGQKEAEMRLKELENQMVYQRGMLALQGRQAGEAERSHRAEEVIRTEATKPTVPSNVLQDLATAEKQMAELDALGKAMPALSWMTELAKKPVQAAHEATKKTVSQYRAMGAQGLPPEPAAAPGPAGATAASVAGPHTHYRYNKDRSMRIPTDAAGNALGAAEPNR